jgi:hypothetical protein
MTSMEHDGEPLHSHRRRWGHRWGWGELKFVVGVVSRGLPVADDNHGISGLGEGLGSQCELLDVCCVKARIGFVEDHGAARES